MTNINKKEENLIQKEGMEFNMQHWAKKLVNMLVNLNKSWVKYSFWNAENELEVDKPRGRDTRMAFH